MNVLILHGIGGKAGIHWQQWLHDELVKAGHNVLMPTLSDADHPDRQSWLAEVSSCMAELLAQDTVIIAHSLGVPTALDYLEKATEPIKALVSVSGFAYLLGIELNDYFMQEKTINFSKVVFMIDKSYVLYGDDDPYVNQTALQDVARELKVEPIIFHNGGHLNTDAGYTEFPELLKILQEIDRVQL